MSRHYIDLDVNDEKVRVTLGYDRPLDEFFMQVESLSPRLGDVVRSPMLYASIDDPENDCNDLSYYERKLREFDIVLPEIMFHAVTIDRILRIGNYIVEHFRNGELRELPLSE